jgi:uncharacterized protein (DUF2237 family)
MARNVLGGELASCGTDPMTGFYRTGCCDTGAEDSGVHTVCAQVTAEFLDYSASVGNDLSTPRPEFGFAGLRPGDRWCLCAARWAEALAAGVAPPVVHQAPTGPLIRFNGTTEWALDSVEQEATVWLPREGQLREALGPHFRRLEPVGDGFAVVIERGGAGERHVDVDAERAYARALLAVLTG